MAQPARIANRSQRAVMAFGLALGLALALALIVVLAIAQHLLPASWGSIGAWGLGFGALYWFGLWLLVRKLKQHAALNAGLIADLRATTRWLAQAERQFHMLFDRNPLPFWVFDADTLRFLEVNQAAIQQYGYSREEFLGMTILDIRPADYRDQVAAEAHDPSRAASRLPKAWMHQRKDGRLLEVMIHTSDIEFRGKRARLILAEDLTESLSYQRELAFRASHDMTTGLLNARALADSMAAHRDPGVRIAHVQLQGLELIEDSLGQRAGEEVLRRMARRLERLGQLFGAVGHVRGEEFALMVQQPELWDQALEVLQAELHRPVTGDGGQHQLESWLGTAEFPRDGDDPLQVLDNARVAAHVARAERLPLVPFEQQMTRRANKRLNMAARIQRALENDEFTLHFQKIHRVAEAGIKGFEALIRWPQAEGGFVPPSEFIDVCEDSGLIVPLGRWTMREAAKAQQRLAEAGHANFSIAVNVSQAQFVNGDLVADFDRVFDEFDLPRGALHVELTESILMTRPEQARATLRRLRERGICVSLDDFGTGFSSLSYLRHLPIDALKIDRSFVHNVDTDSRNASICTALLALGHSLDLTVVAEGVEDQAQYAWLKANGCDLVQGYCLDRPAPLEEVLETL